MNIDKEGIVFVNKNLRNEIIWAYILAVIRFLAIKNSNYLHTQCHEQPLTEITFVKCVSNQTKILSILGAIKNALVKWALVALTIFRQWSGILVRELSVHGTEIGIWTTITFHQALDPVHPSLLGARCWLKGIYAAHDWRVTTSVQRAPITWRVWSLW